jgi:hypothetical protein
MYRDTYDIAGVHVSDAWHAPDWPRCKECQRFYEREFWAGLKLGQSLGATAGDGEDAMTFVVNKAIIAGKVPDHDAGDARRGVA